MLLSSFSLIGCDRQVVTDTLLPRLAARQLIRSSAKDLSVSGHVGALRLLYQESIVVPQAFTAPFGSHRISCALSNTWAGLA
jgi:hypothetical protein